MMLPVRSETAKLLRRSVGRPSLGGDGATGGKFSPRRQVRLPEDFSEGVDALAARAARLQNSCVRPSPSTCSPERFESVYPAT